MNKIIVEPHYASGVLLDYLVAICEGEEAIIVNKMCQILTFKNSKAEVFAEKSYLNSIEGYDIIEREKIDLLNGQFGWNVPHFEYGEYTCTLAYGNSMREAGLRRYVNLKLGDTYTIKDSELLKELNSIGVGKLYQEHCSWEES